MRISDWSSDVCSSDLLDELAESIKAQGLLQPILVRPLSRSRYEIVAGERRWRAAQAAGLHEIPAVIRQLDDATGFELALVENIQRADLDRKSTRLNSVNNAHLVCRLLLEKKNQNKRTHIIH